MTVIGIIPAHTAASRFPGKALVPLCRRPMIGHLYRRAARTAYLDKVCVATPDDKM